MGFCILHIFVEGRANRVSAIPYVLRIRGKRPSKLSVGDVFAYICLECHGIDNYLIRHLKYS